MVLSALNLRRATDADIAAMRAIENDAGQAFGAIPGYEFCVDLESRDTDEHRRVQAHGQALIAELDGTGIGFVLVEPVDGRGHILEVAIANAFQRKGLGRALIDAAELAAKDMGLTKMSLITYREIAWNAPFYRKLGYSELPHVPETSRLAAIMREEIDAGIAAKPRIAMVKAL